MSEAAHRTASTPHPVRLVVTDDLRRNRLTVLLRLLLALPHAIWLSLFTLLAFALVLVAWVVALVTGRVPDALHGGLAAFVRYGTHVYAYVYLAADPFPGFTGARGYPVDVELESAAGQSRLTVLARPLLAIPALVVVWLLHQVAQIVAILAWFLCLFTGRMSEGLRDVQGYVLRYSAQTAAYVLLLTPRYPSFADE